MPLTLESLTRLRPAMQWGLLAAGSALFAAGLFVARVPAPLLIGPMVAAIAVGACGFTIRVGQTPFLGVQALLGSMIAGTVTPAIAATLLADWALFLVVILAIIAASTWMGWVLARRGVLPETTGIWGSSPGAAAAMVVMADEYGADVRLVAFMQYLRVVCVAVGASLVARFWWHGSAQGPALAWFPELHAGPFLETLALAGIGGLLGVVLKIPSGAMLVPLVAGAGLHATGLVAIELPQWLMAGVYALLGWRIGLCFTRPVLLHAARALPMILCSIAVLMVFCGGLAWLLVQFLGTDPLTAYLATSPGGMDTVAVIAASSGNVDVPFVMALQTLRFLLVAVSGPHLARFLARKLKEAGS